MSRKLHNKAKAAALEPVVLGAAKHVIGQGLVKKLQGGRAPERGNCLKGGVGDAPDHSSSICWRLSYRSLRPSSLIDCRWRRGVMVVMHICAHQLVVKIIIPTVKDIL